MAGFEGPPEKVTKVEKFMRKLLKKLKEMKIVENSLSSTELILKDTRQRHR